MSVLAQITSMITSGQIVSLLILAVAIYAIVKAASAALKVACSFVALFATLYFVNPEFYHIASDFIVSLVQSGGMLLNHFMR